MAYLTVTTQADVVGPGDGKLSLRKAVEQANSTAIPDAIRFVASLQGTTPVLTGGELAITSGMAIEGTDGVGDGQITINGDHTSRVFRDRMRRPLPGLHA
jgi:hypothetical protein